MEFSGTTAFVSADIAGGATFAPENGVYSLSLATGTYQQILYHRGLLRPHRLHLDRRVSSTAPPATPVSLASTIFTASQLDTALASGTALQLSQGDLIISNSGNSDFVVVGNNLFDALIPNRKPAWSRRSLNTTS